MTRLVHRLAQTTAGELRFRCHEKALVTAEAVRYASGGATWRRADLRRRLLPLSPQLKEAQAALERGNWLQAGAAVRSHFVQRSARFVIDPARHQEFARTVHQRFPGARQDAISRADRLLAGRYDLLGYRDLSFGNGTLNWNYDPVHDRRSPATFWARVPYLDPRVGDHKIIWELNRHQHWLALGRAAWLTGDARYARAVAGELGSWLQANPPLTGINWSSMLELGFRCISWIWALHLCAPFEEADDSAWFVDLMLGLDRQLDHIARHLSVYFSPNTHLLGEGLALYVAARVLPELGSAARWEQVGRDILVRETVKQVHTDGGHVEQSAHYHRYALDFYLLALTVARRTGDPAARVFEEVTARLATFCRALADDNGRLPAIGDDDGGLLFPICGRASSDASDSLMLAAVLLDRPDLAVCEAAAEEVLWMLGGESPFVAVRRPQRGVRVFPKSGYVVARSDKWHAIVDAGPHGFLNGGHAHADALSLVLSICGKPLLIDPGTATYTTDDVMRDRFRSTAMHNTIVLDDQPQSVPAGPFQWKSTTRGQVDLWRSLASFDCVEARHDGYLPAEHRRAVLRVGDSLWLVADHLIGREHHRAAAYWHFHPAWVQNGGLDDFGRFSHGDGLVAAVVSTAPCREIFYGDAGGLGWCAPVYGQLVPSPTVRFSEAGPAPFSLVTAFAAGSSPVALSIEWAIVSGREDRWHRAAVILKHGDADVVAMFATPRSSTVPPRAPHRVGLGDGELITDARIALLRCHSGVPISLVMIDGTHARWTGLNRFDVAPRTAWGDLQLDFRVGVNSLVAQ